MSILVGANRERIKQQVISRFERVDSLPTLRTFIRYLDSMDLEIEIKEKNKLKKN